MARKVGFRAVASLVSVCIFAVGCSDAESDRVVPTARSEPKPMAPIRTPERYVEVPTAIPILAENPKFRVVGTTGSWTWRSGQSISVTPGKAINIVGFSDAEKAQIAGSLVPVSKQVILELQTTQRIRSGDEIRWGSDAEIARSIHGSDEGILIAVSVGSGPRSAGTEFQLPSTSEVEPGTVEAVSVSGPVATIAGLVPLNTKKVVVAGVEATLLFDPVLNLNWYVVDVPSDDAQVTLEIFDAGNGSRRRSADFSSLVAGR